MKEITLEEALELKRITEARIEGLLNKFQDATECKVESVYWTPIDVSMHKPEEINYLKLEVRLGYKL